VDGATYAWTGEPDNSTTTRTTVEGTDTNLFTNPDMVATTGEVTVWENLWSLSKVSEVGMTKSTTSTQVQEDDGIVYTTIDVPEGASSYIYTSTSYRVPVEEG